MIDKRILSGVLSLSAAGLIGIAMNEGYVGTASPPVKGDVPTVGFGHTGPEVHNGDKTTPQRALQTLLYDATDAQKYVRKCAPVPMTQGEFDAYTSLAYNIGGYKFCASTVVKKLNTGDYAGACAEILNWDKFKGKPLAGLTNRRQQEYKMCMGESNG